MKYQFNKISTVEDILKAIGRTDIPSTDVVLSQPAIDEETGEYLAELEIDFGSHTLSPTDEKKLKSCLASQGLVRKGIKGEEMLSLARLELGKTDT